MAQADSLAKAHLIAERCRLRTKFTRSEIDNNIPTLEQVIERGGEIVGERRVVVGDLV